MGLTFLGNIHLCLNKVICCIKIIVPEKNILVQYQFEHGEVNVAFFFQTIQGGAKVTLHYR